jgi:hypothetical protein
MGYPIICAEETTRLLAEDDAKRAQAKAAKAEAEMAKKAKAKEAKAEGAQAKKALTEAIPVETVQDKSVPVDEAQIKDAPVDEFDVGTRLEYHELANVLPLLREWNHEEFQKMVEDIRTRGLLEPIVIWEEKVLDGRNRFEACLEAGVCVETVPLSKVLGMPDPTYLEALNFVRTKNLRRRHLKPSQLAMYAAEFELRSRNCPGQDVGNPTPKPEHVSQAILAKESGVSRDTFSKAVQIAEHGDPEIKDKVKKGTMSIDKAAAQVRAAKQKPAMPVQAKIKAAGAPAKAPTVKQQRTKEHEQDEMEDWLFGEVNPIRNLRHVVEEIEQDPDMDDDYRRKCATAEAEILTEAIHILEGYVTRMMAVVNQETAH